MAAKFLDGWPMGQVLEWLPDRARRDMPGGPRRSVDAFRQQERPTWRRLPPDHDSPFQISEQPFHFPIAPPNPAPSIRLSRLIQGTATQRKPYLTCTASLGDLRDGQISPGITHHPPPCVSALDPSPASPTSPQHP